MEDEVLHRVFEEGGRDYYSSSSSTTLHHNNSNSNRRNSSPNSPPSPTAASASSILQSLPLHVSFDHGYYLLVKAIQELREKKDGHVVTVGIGGPSGSGKTSLAEKVASVLGCVVISMENYRSSGTDDGNDLDSIDFDALVRNLQDLMKGMDTLIPLFDFQEKRHIGVKPVKVSSCGVIRINNSFVSSFREPYYKLKCKSESLDGHAVYSFDRAETENFIEMYLRPPRASEEARINDWIKVRQCGIRYYLSLGDQRIVDKNFIIRPKAEFEVGRTTLGGLLALGYNVVVSYKRSCTSIHNGQILLALESIDTLNETFLVLKGTSRKVIGTEACRLGIKGPWNTKSYLEMILEAKGCCTDRGRNQQIEYKLKMRELERKEAAICYHYILDPRGISPNLINKETYSHETLAVFLPRQYLIL